MEETASSTKIFWLNYIGKLLRLQRVHSDFHLCHSGLNTPLILIESLGAGMVTVTQQDWQDAFSSGGVGGLLGASLSSTGGFGQFCLVIVRYMILRYFNNTKTWSSAGVEHCREQLVKSSPTETLRDY